MKSNARILSLILAMVLVIGLFGCAKPAAQTPTTEPAQTPAEATTPAETTPPAEADPDDDYPAGPVTWVVPWKPGGANDIVARLIAPELEKQLGVPVTITNTDGAGGWIGYNMILSAPADGYTIGNVSLPGMISSYVNPEAGNTSTYRDFAPLVNLARDYTVICMRPDEDRFSTFAELYEYSKNNEVIIAGTAGSGDDAVLIAQLNLLEGGQFVMMGTGGSTESLTNLYGGHCDVSVANVSEVMNPLKGNQLKVIAISSEERSPQLPDVPTIAEETGVTIIADSSRGVLTRAGVPENRLKILREALVKALETPDLQAKLAEQGIVVEITEWEEYTEILQAIEDQMYELGPKFFGWDVKKP